MTDRPANTPQTLRITLTARPTNARVVPADTPLPPLRQRPSPATSATPSVPAVVDIQAALNRELAVEREQIRTTLANVQTSLKELTQQQGGRLDDLRKAAVELALTIATRLLHREIADGEFPVEEIAREMTGQLTSEPKDSPLTVTLNPDDLKLLQKRLAGEPLFPGREAPQLVTDPSLRRGEVQLTDGRQMLISDLATQLDEIRDELLRSLGYARNPRS